LIILQRGSTNFLANRGSRGANNAKILMTLIDIQLLELGLVNILNRIGAKLR